MYGTTVMGTRGQLVIPADARKDLKLKPGDRLVVIGRFHKILGLIRADEMEQFVEFILKKIDNKAVSKKMREQAKKALKELL